MWINRSVHGGEVLPSPAQHPRLMDPLVSALWRDEVIFLPISINLSLNPIRFGKLKGPTLSGSCQKPVVDQHVCLVQRSVEKLFPACLISVPITPPNQPKPRNDIPLTFFCSVRERARLPVRSRPQPADPATGLVLGCVPIGPQVTPASELDY